MPGLNAVSKQSGHTPNSSKTVRGKEESVYTASLCIIVNESAELRKKEIVDRVTIGTILKLFNAVLMSLGSSEQIWYDDGDRIGFISRRLT